MHETRFHQENEIESRGNEEWWGMVRWWRAILELRVWILLQSVSPK
jgi:hypothetical protein